MRGTYRLGKSKQTFTGEVRQTAAPVKAIVMHLPQLCLSWKEKRQKEYFDACVAIQPHAISIFQPAC